MEQNVYSMPGSVGAKVRWKWDENCSSARKSKNWTPACTPHPYPCPSSRQTHPTASKSHPKAAALQDFLENFSSSTPRAGGCAMEGEGSERCQETLPAPPPPGPWSSAAGTPSTPNLTQRRQLLRCAPKRLGRPGVGLAPGARSVGVVRLLPE